MEPLTGQSALAAITFSVDTLITSFSSGIEVFAGYSKNEIVGRSVARILADSSVFDMPKILDTVKSEGGWEGSITFRDRNKKSVKAYGTVLPLAEGDCRNTGYLLLARLGKFTNAGNESGLEYSYIGNRIRELVHEINNPLAVIMGSTQLLAMNSGCTGKVRSDIEKLYDELEKVAHVVERLHGYAFSLCEKSSKAPLPDNSIVHTS